MGSIKQKEKINENPDDDIYCRPVMKPRLEELAERRHKREFPISGDLEPLRKKMNLIRDVEYQQSGDIPILTKDDLDKERERRKYYRNKQQGHSYTWH